MGFSGVHVEDPETLLRELRRKLENAQIQVVRADMIAGNEHLSLVASFVSRATKRGRMRSKSLAMEFLIYLSGQSQISKAIQTVGVEKDTPEVVVIAISGFQVQFDERRIENACAQLFGGARNDAVIEVGSSTKMRKLCDAFGISEREQSVARLPGEAQGETIKRLVVERSALLSVD